MSPLLIRRVVLLSNVIHVCDLGFLHNIVRASPNVQNQTRLHPAPISVSFCQKTLPITIGAPGTRLGVAGRENSCEFTTGVFQEKAYHFCILNLGFCHLAKYKSESLSCVDVHPVTREIWAPLENYHGNLSESLELKFDIVENKNSQKI